MVQEMASVEAHLDSGPLLPRQGGSDSPCSGQTTGEAKHFWGEVVPSLLCRGQESTDKTNFEIKVVYNGPLQMADSQVRKAGFRLETPTDNFSSSLPITLFFQTSAQESE